MTCAHPRPDLCELFGRHLYGGLVRLALDPGPEGESYRALWLRQKLERGPRQGPTPQPVVGRNGRLIHHRPAVAAPGGGPAPIDQAGLDPRDRVIAGRIMRLPPAVPCVHLGARTGERIECTSCPGWVELSTCRLHDKCISDRSAVQTRSDTTPPLCATCPDYQLPLRFLHGLGDHVTFAHVAHLYRRRGRAPVVHVNPDLGAVWDAAGIERRGEGGIPCDYPEPARVNNPSAANEWLSNKVANNLLHAKLPPVAGDPAALWEELCQVRLRLTPPPAVAAEARAFAAGLRRPIYVLNPCTYAAHEHAGGDWGPRAKDIPEPIALEVLERLAAHGSVIVLNWSGYAREWRERGHVRCVNGRLARLPEMIAALYAEADVLVGIDSGPLHVASMTDIAALGVFHAQYPTDFMLPRARSALLTRGDFADINRQRRLRWNILEYPGGMPTAAAIAEHALRLAAGPRYLTGELIGRDLMLQQWVRDWLAPVTVPCRFHGGGGPGELTVDRCRTIDFLLREASGRFAAPRIVETGCSRPGNGEDWNGAGNSTYLLACYAASRGGRFQSYDCSEGNCAYARERIEPWGGAVGCLDSVLALRSEVEPVDVLYLDSHDTDRPGHAEHGLAEIQAAAHLLHERSLVAIDDTIRHGDAWLGKGRVAVPWLLERGWRVLAGGYQQVLGR